MKKLILMTIMLCCFAFSVKAGLGNCVVYYAKFYLKSGAELNGCFEAFSLGNEYSLDNNGTNSFCSDKGVFEIFRRQQPDRHQGGKVPVYKQLYYVDFVKTGQSRKSFSDSRHFGFVLREDVFWLDSTDIVKMVFWSASYSERYWDTSRVLKGVQGMLDTIQQQKYWNTISTKRIFKGDSITRQDIYPIIGAFGGYALFNYNPKINTAELKRIVTQRLTEEEDETVKEFNRKNKLKEGQQLSPKQQQEYDKLQEQKMLETADWFWKRGVVIIRTNETC